MSIRLSIAGEDAGRAQRLESLARGIVRCRRCPLHRRRQRAVPGAGSLEARIMLVGEAPGAAEDASGLPFVGRSGAYLDGMLSRIGLTRQDVFVTGSVKCRPPGNRVPRAGELRVCREHWLLPQIEALDPPLLVLLGAVAARQVLGERGPLAGLRGPLRRWCNRQVLVTAHPAAAMRFPRARRWLDEDFARLKAYLQNVREDG
ncbi:MAG: uracil-DNA glycosylase [Pseudomonadales bacterium]